MSDEILTSRANERVRRMRRLGTDAAFRRETGEFLCEGLHLLGEAAREGFPVSEIFWDGTGEAADAVRTLAARGARLTRVSPAVVEAAATTVAPQGVVFSARIPTAEALPPRGTRFLILDAVAEKLRVHYE